VSAPRLRAAYVLDSLGPGGTQRALTHLVRGLAGRGWEQTVVGLGDEDSPLVRGPLEAAGARVFTLGKGAVARGAGLVRLVGLLRRARPDVALTLLPWADVLGRPAAWLAGAGVVLSSVRARNVDRPWWWFPLCRLTAPLARRVVFNSREVVPFARAREGVRPEQVVYIPNGCAGAPLPRDRSALAALGVPGDAPVVGSVGRLYAQKNHAALLEALALGRGALGRAHLVLAGAGPLRAELEARAARLGLGERVHLPGHVADVPALLAGLDAYAQPSAFEGMSNSLMEAMAAGLPVVASAVDGNRELVEHGASGLLVPPGDIPALAGALESVLEDRALAARLGCAAARRMAGAFSIEAMVEAYDALFRSFAGRG
jgi:glycosyltransferase involved in cell wall biosynthesis